MATVSSATVLSGVIDDQDIQASQRKVDMADEIAQLEDDVAVLTTMLMKVGKRPAHSTKVEWLEDELVPRLTTLAGSYASAASGTTGTITVATGTGQFFRARDVIRVPAFNENMAVTAVATDTLGVTRSIGASTGASAASGTTTDVVKIGNAAMQGATLGTLLQTKKTAQYNYTQIQRDPWGVVESLAASDLYGGNEPQNEGKKKLIEHKRQLENTAWWGKRFYDTSGSQPVGYAGGITQYISTNITSNVGTLTQAAWETFLQSAFRYGSRNKVVFVSPLVYRAINSWPAGKLAINDTGPGIRNYGVQLASYRGGGTDGGVQIALKRDMDDFSAATGAVNPSNGWAAVLDMDNIKFRPLIGNGRNRDTKLLMNRQANDEDSTKHEYLTEASWQVSIEKSHALMYGVTGYS